eukprot:TRINITY_DN19681_c0_g1_i1.p1 TRINITY_DN19681_c0_g1~~TRINITY_DN19681_c0_g1_i1.p1  ORF type:complete len:344 (+),score=43.96 TRINITY_DN19681_c0_g1_i1:96-1127(+)
MIYIPPRYTLHQASYEKAIVKDTSNRYRTIRQYRDALRDPEKGMQCLKEIKLLDHLRHESIEEVVDMYWETDSSDLFVVTSTLLIDLESLLHRTNNRVTFDHCLYISALVINAVRFAQSGGGFPGTVELCNVSIRENCDIIVTELSRSTCRHFSSLSPEQLVKLVLSNSDSREVHSKETTADLWSLGMIMLQLYTKRLRPLFSSSPDGALSTALALSTVPPSKEEACAIGILEGLPRGVCRSATKLFSKWGMQFDTLLEGVPQDAVELITKLLQLDPAKRISAADALQRPLFDVLELEEEFISDSTSGTFNWSPEAEVTRSRLRSLIWDEIRKVRIAQVRPSR